MKPFNLERAKAGDPIVTRGRRTFVFGGYNPYATKSECVIGWVYLQNKR